MHVTFCCNQINKPEGKGCICFMTFNILRGQVHYTGVQICHSVPGYQVEEFKKHNDISKQIIFTELSFKPGTTIIEESQQLLFAIQLAKAGYDIIIIDSKETNLKLKEVYIYLGTFPKFVIIYNR